MAKKQDPDQDEQPEGGLFEGKPGSGFDLVGEFSGDHYSGDYYELFSRKLLWLQWTGEYESGCFRMSAKGTRETFNLPFVKLLSFASAGSVKPLIKFLIDGEVKGSVHRRDGVEWVSDILEYRVAQGSEGPKLTSFEKLRAWKEFITSAPTDEIFENINIAQGFDEEDYSELILRDAIRETLRNNLGDATTEHRVVDSETAAARLLPVPKLSLEEEMLEIAWQSIGKEASGIASSIDETTKYIEELNDKVG